MSASTNHLDDQHRVYEKRSLEVGEEFHRYADWIMRPLLPHIHGRVLEIGAGLGTIAARYVDRTTSAVLLEPAQNLHAMLATRMRPRLHVQTVCGFVDEVVGRQVDGVDFGRGSFDTVVMVNVLEHIADDTGTMALVRTLLRPHGRVVVFVPALPALFGSYDEKVGHVRRYTKRGLRGLVTMRDFRVAELAYVDLVGMAPWFVSGRLLRQQEVGQRSAQFYDRAVVPVARAIDRLSGPPIGKNLRCVAYAPG